jgi:hypothetical protein
VPRVTRVPAALDDTADAGHSESMNARNFLYVLAILFASAAISADNTKSGSLGGQVNGIEIGKQAPDSKDEVPPRATCLNHCSAAEGRCSREVRRARTDCSRNAASGGNEPFSGPRDTFGGRIDYGDFCSYFANPAINCGSDYYSGRCQGRLERRHNICLNAMRNIAEMRYDCFRVERDATNQCREELRDCKAQCQ